MPTQTNALIRAPRKREEILKSPNGLSDVSILNLAVDPESVFRRGFFRPRVPKERESSDEVFQALLLEANRELARLLQDVRSGSHAALLSGDQSRATSQLLMRAVRCATKQYMLQAELGNLALTDDLTGLYNRRGFMVLAERQLKLARRSGRGMLLFFIDVNDLKQINDSFGHSEGDRSLKSTAQVLEKTFPARTPSGPVSVNTWEQSAPKNLAARFLLVWAGHDSTRGAVHPLENCWFRPIKPCTNKSGADRNREARSRRVANLRRSYSRNAVIKNELLARPARSLRRRDKLPVASSAGPARHVDQ